MQHSYLLSALALVTPVAAQDASTFRDELGSVAKLAKAERFEDALDRLSKLLAANAKRDYAIAAREEILRLDRSCRFHLRYPAPKDQSLISGKIVRYDRARRLIKLRYTMGDLDDFAAQPKPAKSSTRRTRATLLWTPLQHPAQARRQLLFHPAVFRNCRITIKGPNYSFARFIVSLGADGHYDCVVGSPPDRGGQYYPTRIINQRGTSKKELVVKHWGANTPPSKPSKKRKSSSRKRDKPKKRKLSFPMAQGEKFRIEINVGTHIAIKFNGRTIASTTNRMKQSGSFAFDVPQFKSLEISGSVDPSWLQNKRNAIQQQQITRFNGQYRPQRFLPKWLFELAERPVAKKAPAKRFPGGKALRDIALAKRLLDGLDKRNFLRVLFTLGGVSEERIPKPIQDWIRAQAFLGLGNFKRCLEVCETLCNADPAFAPARYVKAVAHARLRQDAKALKELEEAVRIDPTLSRAYTDATRLLLAGGRGDEAAAWLEKARRSGVRLAGRFQLERAVNRLRRGPEWPKSHKLETKHYLIESDIDIKTCKDAARVLEGALEFYAGDLGWRVQKKGDAAQRRFRVFIFSGKAGFDSYLKDLGGVPPIHTAAGLYVPSLRQLLIWNLPNRTNMLSTIRHEGLHQYLDVVLPNIPVWLNEGLAEYFERSRTALGKPSPTTIHHSHLRRLAARPSALNPIKLMHSTRNQFYGNPAHNYAQAWALVHFMRRGPHKWRRIFKTLVAELRSGKAHDKAVAAALEGFDRGEFARAFAEYVDKLR